LWCTLKSKYYALSSRFPLYTYSDHMPLKWMEKTEKGPISSFILEHLSEIDTVHQYIQGKVNTIPDACSRYPMLGPKRLATRGLASSIAEMLRRLPARLKEAATVHYHGGKQGAELHESLRDWFQIVSALQAVPPPPRQNPPLQILPCLYHGVRSHRSSWRAIFSRRFRSLSLSPWTFWRWRALQISSGKLPMLKSQVVLPRQARLPSW
jgi:hypothetical protein